MNRQLHNTMNPNARFFPSISQMLLPHQTFHTTQISPPQPSPPINPPPFKRQRTLRTPTDHKMICRLKKVERQTIKSTRPCTTHQTGMIEMPYQILKCVQAQGLKLSRTNETVEYLSEQVNSLHEMVKTALAELRSSKQTPKDRTTTPHPLLPTYLSLVTQTLETLKTNPPSPNTLQSTSESISKLHQLILLQCKFDSLGGQSSNETSNKVAELSLTLSTTPTLESVLKPLQKMEQNLKTFINLQGTTKKVGSLSLALAPTSRNNDESYSAVTSPLQRPTSAAPTTSTPIKTDRHSRNPSRWKRSSQQKRKPQYYEDVTDVSNQEGINASFGNLSVIPHTTNAREISRPTKKFSFSYVRNSMEVD